MISYLNQLSQQLHLIDKIFGFTPFMYLKDKKGKYLYANQPKLEFYGFKKENDILGLYDTDLIMTNDQATDLRIHDKKIIKTESNHVFMEKVNGVNKKNIEFISYKSPLRLKASNKIAGIIGISFIFPTEFQYKKELYSSKCINMLSKRQNECLYLLAHGMTIKEIAKKIGLSPRTIEHYLEVIKTKLNCTSRSDLIKSFLENQ